MIPFPITLLYSNLFKYNIKEDINIKKNFEPIFYNNPENFSIDDIERKILLNRPYIGENSTKRRNVLLHYEKTFKIISKDEWIKKFCI